MSAESENTVQRLEENSEGLGDSKGNRRSGTKIILRIN